MSSQTCIECNDEKPLDLFSIKGKYRRRICKLCCKEKRQKYIKTNAEKISLSNRRSKAKKLYGEQALPVFDRIVAGEGCEICGGRTTKMAIDHCHNTDVVRGLLCSKCNTAIGLFNENPDLFVAALKYLEK